MRFFADCLNEFAGRIAVITPSGQQLTYDDLAARADAFAASLGPERKLLVVETANELEPLIAYLGALRGRHPVILAAEGSTAADSRIADTFHPYAVYRRSEGCWKLDELGFKSAPQLHEDLAVLLSTSGSTGSAKLVRLSCENVASNAEAIANYLKLDSYSRPITSLQFHYSYGLSVINSHLATGAAILLTNESVTSAKFWDFFREQQATSLAGVPYTFDLLDRIGFQSRDLPSIKQLTQAGGRLAPEKVRAYALWAREHHVLFYVMYGQTEASPRMAYVPPERTLEEPDCIGVPIPGGSFSIIGNDGVEVDQPAETGELVYRGPNVMLGYALSAADLARGRDINELRTGDIACRTPSGLYRIVGRKSRFSKLFGLRLSFDEIEAFLTERKIDSAVTGNDDKIIICTLKDEPPQSVVELVAGRYSIGQSAIIAVQVDEFPRLATGKIDYRLILKAAAQQATLAQLRNSARAAGEASVRESYCSALGRLSVSPDDSFIELGGDSLSYVEVSLAIERHLGYLPEGWEDMSIGQIESLRVQKPGRTSLPTDIFVRFAAIMGVIVDHASNLPIAGGADVLLIIVGYSLARFQGAKLMAGTPAPVILRYLTNFVLVYYAIALIFVPVFDGGLSLKKLWWIASVDYVPGNLYYLWFIEVFFQSVVIISLPFAIPAFRNWVKRFPWRSGCTLLAAAIALHFLCAKVNIRGLYNNYTPENLFLPVLGWCIYFAQTRFEKAVLAVLALIIAVSIYFPQPYQISEGVWILCALPLMLLTKRVVVPESFMFLISNIASASFFIYLTQIGPLLEITAMGAHWWRIPDITIQSLALGLSLWAVVRFATRVRARIRLPVLNWR